MKLTTHSSAKVNVNITPTPPYGQGQLYLTLGVQWILMVFCIPGIDWCWILGLVLYGRKCYQYFQHMGFLKSSEFLILIRTTTLWPVNLYPQLSHNSADVLIISKWWSFYGFNPLCGHVNDLLLHVEWHFKFALWHLQPTRFLEIRDKNAEKLYIDNKQLTSKLNDTVWPSLSFIYDKWK